MKRLLTFFAVFALTFSASIAQGTPVTANVGDKVLCSVSFGGTAPFTFQWRFNGVNISGATASTYAITSAKLTDSGTYDVVVSNSAGSTASDKGVLTVGALPVITQPPASALVINIGSPATLSLTATGTPAPSFQWRKNGVAIAGATASSFTIAAVNLSDAGVYDCVVTNTAGSVTSGSCSLSAASVTPTGVKMQFIVSPAVGG
jgi:hypothetical protein